MSRNSWSGEEAFEKRSIFSDILAAGDNCPCFSQGGGSGGFFFGDKNFSPIFKEFGDFLNNSGKKADDGEARANDFVIKIFLVN